MTGHGCPVLHELDTREDYGDEMNPPVLSGGDYDISAIRDCAEGCNIGAMNRALRQHAARMNLALSRIVNGEATAAGMQAIARNALDGEP